MKRIHLLNEYYSMVGKDYKKIFTDAIKGRMKVTADKMNKFILPEDNV